MKTAELRQKNIDELKAQKDKLTVEKKRIAIEFIKGKEKSSQKVRILKKDLARIETLINEKAFLGVADVAREGLESSKKE